MKNTFLFLAFIFLSSYVNAQDIIVLTNGSQIRAKVLLVNEDSITYKHFNNPDGPTYRLERSAAKSIQYASGTTSVFNEAGTSKPVGGRFEKDSARRGNSGSQDKYVSFRGKRFRERRVHGWYFSYELAYGACNASSSDVTYSTSANSYGCINLSAIRMFNPHFGVQMGLGLEGYNYDENSSGYNLPAADVFHLMYFTFPFRAIYFSNSKKRVGFFATAGIDISCLALANELNSNVDISGYYSSVVVSPRISSGVEFRNRYGNRNFMLGLFGKCSLDNCYSGNPDAAGVLFPGNTGALYCFGITLNYMTQIGRRH